jgi:small subunit ribosomal protein S2
MVSIHSCYPTNNSYSLRCIQVIAGVLGRAGEAGQKQRLAAAAEGKVTYRPAQGLTMTRAETLGRNAKNAGSDVETSSSRMGNNVPREREGERDATIGKGLDDAEEMATKLDEVNDHESHRTRQGRDIKVTS